MKAPDFCKSAACLMEQRAEERDTDGERSMARCVAAFNALYGHNLSETEGWQFMSLLKKSRGVGGSFRLDDYEDDVAYCALAGESAAADHNDACRTPVAITPVAPEYLDMFEMSQRREGEKYPDNTKNIGDTYG